MSHSYVTCHIAKYLLFLWLISTVSSTSFNFLLSSGLLLVILRFVFVFLCFFYDLFFLFLYQRIFLLIKIQILRHFWTLAFTKEKSGKNLLQIGGPWSLSCVGGSCGCVTGYGSCVATRTWCLEKLGWGFGPPFFSCHVRTSNKVNISALIEMNS